MKQSGIFERLFTKVNKTDIFAIQTTKHQDLVQMNFTIWHALISPPPSLQRSGFILSASQMHVPYFYILIYYVTSHVIGKA